ncbi:MAG: hypothetical protein WCA22_16920 [Candidatus Binatus sp.]
MKLSEVLSDRYTIWWMVEGPLLLLVIYAALPSGFLRKLFDSAISSVQRLFGGQEVAGIRSVSSLSATLSVTRGEVSWGYVGAFYGGFSAAVFSIPLFVEPAKPYRIILSVLNLAAALYLCFFNGWFRNKVIGLIGGTRNRPD